MAGRADAPPAYARREGVRRAGRDDRERARAVIPSPSTGARTSIGLLPRRHQRRLRALQDAFAVVRQVMLTVELPLCELVQWFGLPGWPDWPAASTAHRAGGSSDRSTFGRKLAPIAAISLGSKPVLPWLIWAIRVPA